jgi:hypothetical protein
MLQKCSKNGPRAIGQVCHQQTGLAARLSHASQASRLARQGLGLAFQASKNAKNMQKLYQRDPN